MQPILIVVLKPPLRGTHLNQGAVCYDVSTLQGYSGGNVPSVRKPERGKLRGSDVGIGFALQLGLVSVCLYESQVRGGREGVWIFYFFFPLCRWVGLGNRGKWEGEMGGLCRVISRGFGDRAAAQ